MDCSACTTGRPVVVRGMCRTCYARNRKRGAIQMRTYRKTGEHAAPEVKPRVRKRQRVVTCAVCKQDKEHKARNLCAACYERYNRKGIIDRAAPKLPRNHWTAADLLTLKKARAEGKTVSECAALFPERSYFSVRNCLVSRKIVRRVPLAEVARGTAYTLNRNKNGMPGWWHRETKREEGKA